MCELFALSSRTPTTVTLSLETFARRGGRTGPHSDGWGIAYHDGRDALIVRDVVAAASSPWMPFVTASAPMASIVLSHIRRATQGAVALPNTQPFHRELGGRVHVFIHNGDLDGVQAPRQSRFRPIGETDSERAFCLLLDRMSGPWLDGTGVPPLAERARVFCDFCAEMAPLGPANFLYTDGTTLFAHGHKRTQDDGIIRTPGLHVLSRTCSTDRNALAADGITIGPGGQSVLLFASVPLSGEDWRPLGEGEVVIAEAGREIGAA